MRKSVLWATVILATVCLAGCNSKAGETPDEPVTGTISEVGSETVNTPGAGSDTSENESDTTESGSDTAQNGNDTSERGSETTQNSEKDDETSAEPSGAIQIDIEEGEYNCKDTPFLWSVAYEYPVLDDDRYPELSQAIQDYRMNYVRNIEAARDDLAELAEQDYLEYGAEEWMGYYSIVESMTVKRADATAASIVVQGYVYQGGAHGTDGYGCFNVDTKTGEQIALDDVIADMDALSEIIATELLELYPDITYWTPTLAETFEAYIEPEITLTWTLEYNGVTFYFGSYEVGSYADGRQQVTVLYSEYPSLFHKYYFESVTDDYVIPVSEWGSLDVDLDGDGDTDHITIVKNYTNSEGGFSSFTIRIDGQEYTEVDYGLVLEPYYVRANGKSYLYVTSSLQYYAYTFVYEITETGIVHQGGFHGVMRYFTNSSDFCVIKSFNRIGNLDLIGTRACYVGPNGMPVKKDGVCDVTQIEYADYVSLGDYEGIEIIYDYIDVYVGDVMVYLPYYDETSLTEYAVAYYYCRTNPEMYGESIFFRIDDLVFPTDDEIAQMGIPEVTCFRELKNYVSDKVIDNAVIIAFMDIEDAIMEQIVASSVYKEVPEEVIMECERMYSEYLSEMMAQCNEIGKLPSVKETENSAYKVLAAMAIAEECGFDRESFKYRDILEYLIIEKLWNIC